MSKMRGSTTVEDCRVLDVHEFHREGFLDEEYAGGAGSSTWSRNGEEVATIGWRRTTTADDRPALRLFYTVDPDGAAREVDYLVPLQFTECHFGGERPWFTCPGTGCHERVGKLYKPPFRDRFLCRECHGLAYESQQRQGELVFESVTKPLDAVDDAIDALEDGPITRDRLREVYEGKVEAREGLRELTRAHGLGGGPEIEELPPFEEWVDDLLQEQLGKARGRPYGFYGRCEATSRTTGERCGQPARGPHGKCYYHGGAPGAGAPEGNQNATAE